MKPAGGENPFIHHRNIYSASTLGQISDTWWATDKSKPSSSRKLTPNNQEKTEKWVLKSARLQSQHWGGWGVMITWVQEFRASLDSIIGSKFILKKRREGRNLDKYPKESKGKCPASLQKWTAACPAHTEFPNYPLHLTSLPSHVFCWCRSCKGSSVRSGCKSPLKSSACS
jgi:hypothetical protein